MPLPINMNSSEFYRLISSAMLASNRGYKTIGEFYREEFLNYFTGAQWRELFDMSTEENRSGKFTQYVGNRYIPVMAAYTARDGEAPLISNEGFELQTKDMPIMKLAYNFNEKSVEEGKYLEDNMGQANLGNIFNSFRVDNVKLLAGIHVQRSYTAFQIESTGGYLSTIDNNSGGLVGLKIDFNIPDSNRKKCGGYGNKGKKKTWTDPDSSPIGDLIDMKRWADDHNIEYGVYRMNQATYDMLVDHPDTKKRIALFKTNYLASDSALSSVLVDEADLAAYLSRAAKIAPIEVVKYKATSQCIDPETQKLVKLPMTAFADNTVLLRPSGKIGTIQWKKQTNLFATAANPMYYADGDSISVQQEIFSAAKAMQFTASSLNIPVPGDVSQWLYLTTKEAAV